MKILIVSADRTVDGGIPANLGDAFLTDAFADAIEGRGHEVDVIDFGGHRDDGGRARTQARGLKGLWASVRSADAVVLGGGTLLQDDDRTKLFGGLPRLCAVVSLVARINGRPLRYFGVGCDPIARTIPRLALKLAVSGSPSWVREEESRRRFAEMFGFKPQISSDVALLSAERACEERSKAVTIALNRDEAPSLSRDLLKQLKGLGLAPQFLSMDQQPTFADHHFVSNILANELTLLPTATGWKAAWRAISTSRIVIASRMHALYMAALAGIPAVAIGDKAKVSSFAKEFNIPIFASVADYTPGSERLASESAVLNAVTRVDTALDSMLKSIPERGMSASMWNYKRRIANRVERSS